LAVTLGVVACVVGAVGIAINGTFAGNLGRTPEALALLLPTVTSRLAQARHFAGAAVRRARPDAHGWAVAGAAR
jgi:hypothetical protein